MKPKNRPFYKMVALAAVTVVAAAIVFVSGVIETPFTRSKDRTAASIRFSTLLAWASPLDDSSATPDESKTPEPSPVMGVTITNSVSSDETYKSALTAIAAPSTATPMPTSAPPVVIEAPQQTVPDQVVIRFESGTTQEQRDAYIESIGGTTNQDITALDTVVVSVPQEVAARPLPESPVVAASEPDYYVTALDGPLGGPLNDPFYPQQWALPVIGAPDAWASLPSDVPMITVAVIDSGICADHPDLVGHIVNSWDFLEQDAAPQDDFGHGCSVAGIIAANPNNGIGIAGVAPNAQIMPLRVLNAQGIGSYSDVAAAIVYATDHGAQIINLSLGGTSQSSLLENAVNYAISREVMVIAAAGNTGQAGVLYPAAYTPVIAVASVDSDLRLSSFSSYGPQIDLLAPGRDILTTQRDGGYGLMSGTSFAAPQVTGVAALEKVQNYTLTLDGSVVFANGQDKPSPEPTANNHYLGLVANSVTYNRDAAYDWASTYWSQPGVGSGQCTGFIGGALSAGGIPNTSSNWIGNHQFVQWMEANPDKWELRDVSQLERGDVVLYTYLSDQEIQNQWPYSFSHSALVISSGRIAQWNQPQWDKDLYNVYVNDGNGNPVLARRFGYHITSILSAPANTELLSNRDFSNGTNSWWTWGSVVDLNVSSGVLRFYRSVGSTDWAAVVQSLNYSSPTNAPFEVTVQLGNSSNVTKNVTVALHDMNTWSGSIECYFSVPVNSSLRTYTVRGKTSAAWPRIQLEIASNSADGQPYQLVDNISVQYKPDLSISGVECQSPSLVDLSLTKSDSADPVFSGSPLTYTLTAHNNGASAATGVVVVDPLSAGLTYVSSSSSQGTCSAATLYDNFDDTSLDPTKWTTVLSGIPGSPSVTEQNGRIEMVTRGYLLTAQQYLPSSTNPIRITGRWTFASSGDFMQVLTRSDGVPAGTYGETQNGVEFRASEVEDTISILGHGSVSVSGTSAALTIDLNDVFDFEITDNGTNLSFTLREVGGQGVSATINGTSSARPSTNKIVFHNREDGHVSYLDNVFITDGTPRTVVCSLGGLANGATATVTINTTVSSSASGTVINTATIEANESDSSPANNTATQSTAVQTLDLVLTNVDSVDPVEPGSTLEYTITVTNSSVLPATGVIVTDTLPSGVSFVSATPSKGSCGQPSNGIVTCTIGSLGGEGNATITIRVMVNSITRGTLHNDASVTANEPETTLSNNSDGEDTIANFQTDLAITMVDGLDPVQPGNTLTYTLLVANDGPRDATGTIVTDSLPSGATYIQAISSQGTCDKSGSTITCNLGSLSHGTTATVLIHTIVEPSARGTLHNTAHVIMNELDTSPTNDEAAQDTTIDAKVDLAILGSVSNSTVTAGTNIIYTFVASNQGSLTATNVQITDVLPTSLTYNSATATQGSCSQSGGTATCSIGALAPGASAVVTIQASVNGATRGTLNNTGRIASLSEADLNSTNDTASVSVTVDAKIDLSITDTASADPVLSGGDLSYSLRIANLGPSTATNVQLIDTLPSGVNPYQPPSGCSISGRVVTCDVGALASGASSTVTLTVYLPTTSLGLLTNRADVNATEHDLNSANNTATISTASYWHANGIHQGTLNWGETRSNVCIDSSTNEHRWYFSVPAGNSNPYLIDVQVISGDLRHVMILKDGSGAWLTSPISSAVDGHGVVAIEPPTGSGDRYISITRLGGTSGCYNIAIWSNSIPRLYFSGDGANEGQSAHSDIRHFTYYLDRSYSYFIRTVRTDGNLEYTYTVQRRGGAVLCSGTSRNGEFVCVATSDAGDYDVYLSPLSGTSGSYRMRIVQGNSTIVPPAILSPQNGNVVALGFNVTVQMSVGSGRGTPAVRVQVDNNSDFGSPEFDNGVNGSTDTTIPVALAASGSYHVRVLQTDRVGGTSAWTSAVVVSVVGPDLAISQTGSTNPVTAGAPLTYVITITNNGPSTATGVVLTDSLPPKTIFVSAISSQGTCSQSNGTVTCNLGNLAAGATATVAANLTVDLSAVGSLTNEAHIVSSQSDPDDSNNTSIHNTNVVMSLPPSAPTGLAVTSVDSNQISLVWSDNSSNESAFRIERSTTGTSDWVEINSTGANQTFYLNSNLTCSTQYYYRIRAYRTDGQYSNYSNIASATVQSCPLASPTALAASTTSETQITLIWTDNTPNETAFRIERSPDGTTGWAEVGTTTANATTFTNTGLTSGTRYYYRVRAYRSSDGQYSAYSNIANAMTWLYPLDLLTLTDGAYTNDTTPAFTWSGVTGATMYRLQVAKNASFTAPLAINVTRTVPNFTATAALANGQWYWRVQVQNANGAWSNWSVAWTFTVDTVKPVKPMLSSPANTTTVFVNQPEFTWTDASNPAGSLLYYRIQVDNTSTFASPESVGQPTGLSYVPTVPLADTVYYWRVQAVDLAGNTSDWSLTWNVRVDAIPATVPVLFAPAEGALVNTTAPTFTWGDLSGDGVKTYRFQIGNDAAFASLRVNTTLTATTYKASGLPNNMLYWRVQSRGADGAWGAFSSPQSFTVNTTLPPKTTLQGPGNNTTVTMDQPTFQWAASTVTDFDHYEFQLDNSSAFTSLEISEPLLIDAQFIPTSGYLPDGKYYWRVQVVDTAGNKSGWTGTFAVTISAVDTPVPTLLALVEGTITNDNTPTLTWEAVPGALAYRVQIDDSPDGLTPVVNVTRTVPNFTAGLLASKPWYWRVQAQGGDGLWGNWSALRSFTVDTVKPVKPVLTSPATNTTTTLSQPEFAWTDASNPSGSVDYYRIQIDNTSNFSSPEATGQPTGTSFMPAVPLADGLYYWRVQAVDLAGNASDWSLTWNVRVDAAPTTIPTLLTLTNGFITKDNTPTLTWEAVSGAPQYRVQIDDSADCASPTVNVTRTVTNFTAGTLANKLWYWRVQALGTDGAWSAWSDTWSFTVDTALPPKVTLLGPANNGTVNSNQPQFTWSAPEANLDHYEFQLDNLSTFASPEINEPSLADALFTLPTSILPDAKYYWRVQVVDTAGNKSGWAGPFTLTIDMVATPEPVLLTPTEGFLTKDNTPSLTWTSVPGALRYQVRIDNNADCASPAVNVTRTTPDFTAGTLANGLWYWCVQATGGDNQPGNWTAPRWFKVDTAVPPKVTLLGPANNGTVSINTPEFTWAHSAADDFDHYEFQLDNLSTFASPEISQLALVEERFTPAADLLPDAKYYWRVQVVDTAGNKGGWSGPFAVTISAVSTPEPVLLTPTDGFLTNDNTPTLTWAAVPGALRYQVRIDNNADCLTPSVNVTRTTPDFTAGTLANGLWYWCVQATSGDNQPGGWSASWSFTVDTVKPVKPVLSGPATNTTTVLSQPEFTWTDTSNLPSSLAYYRIQIDNTSTFASPEATGQPMGTSYVPTLADGLYYWHVQAVDLAGNASDWSLTWTLRVDAVATTIPTLLTLTDGFITKDNTPTLTWQALPGAPQYRVQIDDSADCLTPSVNVTRNVANFTAGTLANKLWYWRVQTQGADGAWSAWSDIWSFTVDTAAPPRPTLQQPANNSTALTSQPEFTWTPYTGADFARYEIQVDNQSTFTSPEINEVNVLALPYTPAEGLLADGKSYWRVRTVDQAGNLSIWSATFAVMVNGQPTPAPQHLTLADGSITNDTTPTLTWGTVPGALAYRVQLSREASCITPALTVSRTVTNYTPTTALSAGTWYWCLQAQGADSQWSEWGASAVWSLVIDVTKPAQPVLETPAAGSGVVAAPLTLNWSDVPDADHYEVQVAPTATFTAPLTLENLAVAGSSYTAATLPADGSYYWRVQAVDAAGNKSGWTSALRFTLDVVASPAGMTALVVETPAPTEPPTVEPTVKPTTEPTVEPTAVPTATFEPSASLIESGDARVVTTGTWTAYASDLASGGGYLFSSGSADDTLSLSFEGGSLTVVYIKHPALGAFIVEVDGSPLQAVDSASVESVFGARVSFALSEGTHTVRVYPVYGTMAIDAFDLAAQAVVIPTPTAVPTEPPTVVPTAEPTAEPTVKPTTIPEPSSPLIESGDARVTPNGTWTAYTSEWASSGEYLYSSGSATDTLSLCFEGTSLGVIYVKHPALGAFIVEVDGAPLQAVDSTSVESVFNARVSFALAEGVHTVRIYPLYGAIAIDAFDLAAQTVVVPTPTVVPTTQPTGEPTVDPTIPATDEPTAWPTATPFPTTTPLPVLLPYVESFDSGTGWTASGAWQPDTQTAHSGGSWAVSSTQRGQSSTLTAGAALDLRTASNPELTFWQRTILSTGDIASLEVSLDGEQTWQALDLQTGPVADWSPRVVNLSAYRGLVIALRFRLDTFGLVPEGALTAGWWVDDLAILEVPVVPPTDVPTATPVPTDVPTAIPTEVSTEVPAIEPTMVPTEIPTEVPTVEPTAEPVATSEAGA